MSQSDVDPAAPLDEARGGGFARCAHVFAPLPEGALACPRELGGHDPVLWIINRGRRPCRRPRLLAESEKILICTLC